MSAHVFTVEDEKDLITRAHDQVDSPFDYIIVGSGAGGGPLACRLALAKKKVLLIEAGGDPKEELRKAAQDDLRKHGENAVFQNPDDALAVAEAPLFHGASTEEPSMSWQFSVRHYEDDAKQQRDHKYDATRDPSNDLHKELIPDPQDPQHEIPLPGSPTAKQGSKGGIFYPRSAGIGGCTGHHAMIVIKPNDHDWDEIAKLTNDPTWSAKSMQPYFARMEQCLYVDEYGGALSNTLGWFYKLFQALMRFINPKAMLDEGGHGKAGWQPTSFISLKLVQRIVKTDKVLTTVLIKSAFKVIEGSGPLTATLKRFLITLGFVRPLDPNDASTRADFPNGGVFLIPIGTGGEGGPEQKPVLDELGNSLKGCRVGVREFILKTKNTVNAREENEGRLVIAKGVHVKRVLFDDSNPPRAIGVLGVAGDHLYRASPKHDPHNPLYAPEELPHGESYFTNQTHGEVILCGGAFNTPQLLMLSGIGPEDQLQQHNIQPKVILPGVGKNLQDRYEVTVVSELKEPLNALDTVAFDPTSTTDKMLDEWRKNRTGLYTSNGGTLAILTRSEGAQPDRPGPDLLTFGAPAAFRGYYWNYSKEVLRPFKGATQNQSNLWTWVILKAYTRNNGGTVTLRSNDPFDTPEINFRSFDDLGNESPKDWDKDIEALAETVEAMRAINSVEGSPFKREIQPLEYIQQRGITLREWIKNEAWGHHACGTCRIGSDPWQKDVSQLKDKNAVLDSHFKVHGVEGLRVVDASVFPSIPGYFILAPIFMMSEKAAETILTEGSNLNYPSVVQTLETRAIQQRRAKAWVDSNNIAIPIDQRVNPQRTPVNPQSIVALALSGGGVRSATFSLGVVQALAKKGKLRHIDYLSTVSGGGFTGSFLGRLFTRKGVADLPDPCARVEEMVKNNDSSPLRWLRTQGNYLFASGTDDYLVATAVYFRNVFTVHFVIGALLVALFGVLAGISDSTWYQKLIPHPDTLDTLFKVKLSLWWWLPIAMLGLVILPMKLGYWLAPKRGSYRTHPPHTLAAWMVAIAGSSIALSLPGNGAPAGLALLVFLLAWVCQELARRGIPDNDTKACQAQGLIVRNRLTRGLGEALVIFLVIVLWIAVDSFARSIADLHQLPAMIGGLIALAPALQMLRSKAMSALAKTDSTDPMTKLKATGMMLAFALLVLADIIAHTLFIAMEPKWAWGTIAILLVFSAAIGRAFDFLNFTSLNSTYGARIVRTFLGASNAERTQGTDNMAADVQVTHPDDDLPHAHYRPEQQGGPLHLISVCVNETVDHASQREIRERKGLLMTIGTFGVSVGRRYFATWSKSTDELPWQKHRRWLEGLDLDAHNSPSLEPVRLDSDPNTFHPLGRRDGKPAVVQSLTLGDWVAVSGAAFSTGNGRSTNPLLALFMGLCNVRLGFWWGSGIRANERSGRFPANAWRRLKELPGMAFRAHQLLLSEWKGRFDGPSHEFWNLSDGGHLDNSSSYELIRRKVPFIICTDATHDQDYSYSELANLVRNVRVDFDAEFDWVDPVNFTADFPPAHVMKWLNIDPAHPTSGPICTLTEIKGNRSGGGPGTKHAALARVRYADNSPDTWLLLIKASLTAEHSLDITQYATANTEFPQDSTEKQIYNDEQWESYRKLGEIAATAVLR